MSDKKMPTVSQPRKMDAALDVLIDAYAHTSRPDEFCGTTEFYFDEIRSIRYTSRWRLKTQEGAFERQKRETIAYLKALRSQIDEVLARLETTSMDEDGSAHVCSSAYQEYQS